MAVEYNIKTWKQLLAINKMIGAFIGVKPEIEYCVGDEKGTSYTYSPKNIQNHFQYPEQQKAECERWIKEQKQQYKSTGYAVIKLEIYPRYDMRMDELMKAYDYIEGEMGARTTLKNTQPQLVYSVHIVSSLGGFREAGYEHKDRHTAFYYCLSDFVLKSHRLAEEVEDTSGFHKCPYCEQRFGQINDYFTHIELFHSDKPLIRL